MIGRFSKSKIDLILAYENLGIKISPKGRAKSSGTKTGVARIITKHF